MLLCMRTTIHLPDDLHRRAKRVAANEGRTLTELIEEGLRTVLSRRVGPSETRIRPRVSAQSGRVMPGIDLTKTSELLDLLEDELPLEKRR